MDFWKGELKIRFLQKLRWLKKKVLLFTQNSGLLWLIATEVMHHYQNIPYCHVPGSKIAETGEVECCDKDKI